MANRQRDVLKARSWRRWIAEQRKSRLSVRAFCAEHQLSEPSFYAWRRTLAQRKGGPQRHSPGTRTRTRRRNTKPAFVNLTTRGATPLAAGLFLPAASLELVHPCGHVLRIAASCDAQTLSMVLTVLSLGEREAAPC